MHPDGRWALGVGQTPLVFLGGGYVSTISVQLLVQGLGPGVCDQ